MDLPPIIPLFVASGVFGVLGLIQFAMWVSSALSPNVGAGRWVMLASAIAYSLIGTIFFAGARRQRERNHWALSGRCIQCGYRLTGNISGTCPECGRKVR